jgi:hypothetical protein
VVQAAEAVVVLAATVLAGADAASGQSYHVNSGIALTVIGAGATVAVALTALGLARARRWSRTPALLTQLFVGIVGIYLLQGHRLDWGVPSVVLAVLGFAALLSPPSLRALSGGDEPGQAQPGGAQQARQPTPPAARPRPGRKPPAAQPRRKPPAARPRPGRKPRAS